MSRQSTKAIFLVILALFIAFCGFMCSRVDAQILEDPEHCCYVLQLNDSTTPPIKTYADWHGWKGPNADGRHPYYLPRGAKRLQAQPWYRHPDPDIVQRYTVSQGGVVVTKDAPYNSIVRLYPNSYETYRVQWELLRAGLVPLVSGEYTFTPECLWDKVIVDWSFENE